MKKLLAITLSAFVGAVLAIAIIGIPLRVRAGGAATPSGNGDVNGDGMIDVSDAVYTLLYLFKGGQPPVACADTPELVGRVAALEAADAGVAKALEDVATALREFRAMPCRERRALPDTGQTKCYDGSGAEVPCDGATCPGQDGSYATGCPSEGRFTDNGDGTVTDNCTGLMWQKDTAPERYTWCNALSYCENLSLGGGLVAWDDWRLPNVQELQSIVDYGRTGPAIDPVFGAFSTVCWSSTSIADTPGYAWHVVFSNGSVGGGGKDVVIYARAVRSGP